MNFVTLQVKSLFPEVCARVSMATLNERALFGVREVEVTGKL